MSNLQYRILTGCGVLALGLLAASVWLYAGNRGMAGELELRQQYVQQTVPLEQLYQDIAKSLAELALRTNDRSVIAMLAQQGIEVTPNKPAAPQETR